MPCPDLSCLSPDSKALIIQLYKRYLISIESGVSVDDALFCGGSSFIHQEGISRHPVPFTDALMRELEHAGFVECFYADNEVQEACLTLPGIASLKNRFSNGLKDIARFIADLIP